MRPGTRSIARITLVLAFGSLIFAGYVVSTSKKRAVAEPASADAVVSSPWAGGDASKSGVDDARYSIGAVGLIEPQTELIQIGTHVSGVVKAVNVKPGQRVRQGEALFLIDDREATARLNGARASLAISQAKLAEALARISTLKDKVKSAESQLKASEADSKSFSEVYERDKKLLGRKAISREEIEITKNKYEEALSRISDSRAQLEVARDELRLSLTDEGKDGPSIVLLRAEEEQARIELETQKVGLELCRVDCPVDGNILQINVRVGEFAQASLNETPLMVVGNVDTLHLRVEIDESEIHRYDSGEPAVASPRGESRRRIDLEFVRVERLVMPKQVLTGSTTQRIDTRVLQVVYALASQDTDLFPGQQMDVFIRSAKP